MTMELENIVANTVYIKAREGDRGRSKKWKDMLKLPPVANTLCLREEIEHTFEYLIEQQPIGKRLFLDFCATNLNLSRSMQFLTAVEELDIVVEGKKITTARQIFEDFISMESEARVECITEKQSRKVQEQLATPLPPDIFTNCYREVKEFLSGQPLIDFCDSPYYWRFLQWKYLERMPVTKDSFRQYRVLGKGGFGLVLACQSKVSGKMYALKKLEKKRVKKRKGEKLAINEKTILEKVNSRFVVSLAYAYQSKDFLCMVLTLMNGGDLRFHIYNVGGSHGLSPDKAVFYAAEVACGLCHLHKHRIAYRDMKPDNILLDDEGHLRISDLGLAVNIPDGQSVRGRVGTPGYMAPEVIDNHRYTFSPDWWGLGCLIYEMVAGKSPFRRHKERVSREEVERRVKDEQVVFNEKFSDEAKLICTNLLEKVHAIRLGCYGGEFEDIKAHPYFRSINWAHLEAGKLDPPFRPNPRAVYAKDVLDIDNFSSVRGVEIEQNDVDFANKFATGAVSKPWQEEMTEMNLYDDINKLHPISRKPSLQDVLEEEEEERQLKAAKASSGGWFSKMFKVKR